MAMLLDQSASSRTFFNMRPTAGTSSEPWERAATDRAGGMHHPHSQPRPLDSFGQRSMDPGQHSSRGLYGGGSSSFGSMGPGFPSGEATMGGAHSGAYQTTTMDAPVWGYQPATHSNILPPMAGSSNASGRGPAMSVARQVSSESLTGSTDTMSGYPQSSHFAPRPQSASGIPPYGYGGVGGGSGHGLGPELSPGMTSSYEMQGPPHSSLGSGMVGHFSGSASYPGGSYSALGGDPRYTTSIHSVDTSPYYGGDLGRGTTYMNPYEVKHRRRTTKAQFRVLEDTFQRTPKPTADLRRSISEQLDMPPRAVQIWFQNRRAKAKNAAKRSGASQGSGPHRTDSGSGEGTTGGRSHSGSDPTLGFSSASSSSSALKRESETPSLASPTDLVLRTGMSRSGGDPPRPSGGGVSHSSVWGGAGSSRADQQDPLDQSRWR